ncbi:MAG: tRNA uridine(34) 5-carboxymethylaminomethyl modification radical SAM/GNAT enzyme Elp3 [Candidatus Pacebacteria bacterium]|nr:tRNA uridine(34) 5-carboxymethylaminomethyl modification radical SAM/GNAT enzyme Elp3 [Candidatus Paceibacterota bacterium]
MINEYIIKQLLKKIPIKNQNEYFLKLKRKASKKFGLPNPTNIEVLEVYRKMLKNKKIKPNKNIENLLITKKMRTLSGVAVIAVLTKPYPCPGTCKFCPNEKNMPKSYLSNEPAVMRAILTDFHPYKQVMARLKSLEATGHKTDKIELIIMGGTFSYLPKQYQTWFVKECFRACNETATVETRQCLVSTTLKQLQKTNEKSEHRIIGLTLETRPDYIDQKEIIRMRKLGATRVELGVQSIYDDVLKLNKRGHSVAATIKATRLLKEAGFKINYHLMPNLPGSSCKRDLEMFKELFSNPDFQPDMLKIYPCVVVKNAPIYKWLKTGKYKPYLDQELIELLAEIKKIIPYYVRITRLIRDIPSTSIVAGNKVSNLRQVLKKKSEEEGWRCKCIRCREIRDKFIPRPAVEAGRDLPLLKLFRQDYNASGGREIFLSFEDRERKYLYSLLRLRINKKTPPTPFAKGGEIIPALQNAAIIREIHTYGQMMPMKSKNKNSPQHIGLGKKLILEAEKIARKEFNLKKIAVISGIGVRDYYRKLGYRLEDRYMVKKLK